MGRIELLAAGPYYGEPGYQPTDPQWPMVMILVSIIVWFAHILILYWIIRTAVLHAMQMHDRRQAKTRPMAAPPPQQQYRPTPQQPTTYQVPGVPYQPATHQSSDQWQIRE